MFAKVCLVTFTLAAQTQPSLAQGPCLVLGAKVLGEDGTFASGRAVLIRDGRIAAIAAENELGVPAGGERIDLSGCYLLPGLIDLHTHLLLRPYDEMSWNDQVLTESLELRTIRATVAGKSTLLAGFTTVRELGTEGAAFADVGLRDAIDQGIVEGPRIFCATRALVATGCYGPSGFDPRWTMPVGAQVADGVTELRKAVREQIAAGASWIKYYGDYRRQRGAHSTPTFSAEEVAAIVDEARSAGVPVAAHAVTSEAILRAVHAGVRTIEHGYQASEGALQAMRDHDVVLCPTLAANEAIVRYAGGSPALQRRLNVARVMFARALADGVEIACGSDAGVFRHGDNARELELMVDYGMTPAQALAAATTTAARVLGQQDRLGRISVGYAADLIAVRHDPLESPRALREVVWVMKNGVVSKR